MALVQNASEMLVQPAHDLRTFLSTQDRWDVQFFTERTFGGVVGSQARFDCVVVGYNAAYMSKLIRRALAQLEGTGILMLHQMSAGPVPFLDGEQAITLCKLDEEIEPVRVASGRDRAAEPLLNWPNPVGIDDRFDDCAAIRTLEAGPGSRWRTVLEVQRGDERLPVLLRSPLGGANAVVCTALLQHRIETHAELLVNAVTWAAGGRPQAVIAKPASDDPAAEARAEALQRKLHLQGITATLVPVADQSELDFDSWPLRGVSTLLVPPEVDPAERTGEPARSMDGWLEQGGRIARLSPASLEIRHRASDVRWAAELWAAWFAGRREVDWHGATDGNPRGSIVRSRAVLETLDLLNRQKDADVGRLGLPTPESYAKPIERLLARRVPLDNCDATVGVTVAALELDRLVGRRALDPEKRLSVMQWLVAQADAELDLERGPDGTIVRLDVAPRGEEPSRRASASAEEVFEIARYLGSPKLLYIAVGRLIDRCVTRDDRSLSAVAVMKLREAAIACRVPPGQLGGMFAGFDWDPEPELNTSPLLAAHYLRVACEVRSAWGEAAGPLGVDPGPTQDRAIGTIVQQGWLTGGARAGAGVEDELVCAAARAVIAYLSSDEPGTHVLGEAAGAVPPQLLSLILEESEELRSGYALLQHDQRLLGRARHVAAAEAVAITGVASAVIAWLVTAVGDLGVLADVASIGGAFSLVMLIAFWALRRFELAPAWFGPLARTVAKGIPGLRDRLVEETETPAAAKPRP